MSRPIDGSPRRQPTCYVVHVPAWDECYGPFEDEEQATLWVSELMPNKVIFQIIAVFDRLGR
jgi:hypothetical protein